MSPLRGNVGILVKKRKDRCCSAKLSMVINFLLSRTHSFADYHKLCIHLVSMYGDFDISSSS